ncbi:MAG: protein kinase [Polyangiaceae bacterium]
MAQQSEVGAFDHTHLSSSAGRARLHAPESPAPAAGASAPPPRGIANTLVADTPGARERVGSSDPTVLAEPTGPSNTPPTSPERLAMLAASLPAVPRDAYQLGHEVAKGGIGRVMYARDQRLDRPVAIKELLTWNEKQEQRFVREALLTARLQHPAIVPIYEAGRWPDGEPFYAMKLVSGRSLADLVGEQKTLAERLSLLPHVIAAAQAVAFAHSKRIIHRDLKPANVLVGELGETVVIDWGLAKDLAETDTPDDGGPAVSSKDGLTIDGAVVGTPAYMPPEQASGRTVDERADVYALGAMLYHVLAAVPPYHDVPWEKLLATITERAPRAIEKLAPQISDELATIVNKAMAREPERRYRTAKELAADLERFQTGQVVAAHTYSARQVLRRYWKRNRTILSVGAAALALVTLVIALAFLWTDKQRRFAEAKQHEAEAAQVAETRARAAAQLSEKQATARADEMTLLQARAALQRDPNLALAWLKTLSPDMSDAGEIRRIASEAVTRGVSRSFRGHTGYINHVDVLPGATLFATASDDKTSRIWDMATGTSRALAGHTDEVWNVALFPGGKAAASVSKDSTLRIWDLSTGATTATLKLPAPGRALMALGDGTVLGTPGFRGEPWRYKPGASAVERLVPAIATPTCSAFSRGGERVLVAKSGGDIVLEDLATAKQRTFRASFTADLCALGGSGDWALLLAVGSSELWDLSGERARLVFQGKDPADAFTASKRLAGLVDHHDVRIIDAATGKELHRLRGHEGNITAIAFSDDEQLVATGSFDRTVRTWDLVTGERRVYAGTQGRVTDVRVLPGTKDILATSGNGEIRLFRPSPAGKILTAHEGEGATMAVSPSGKILSVDRTGDPHVTSMSGEALGRYSVPPALSYSVVISPDERSFAVSSLAWKLADDRLSEAPTAEEAVLSTGTFGSPELTRIPLGSTSRGLHYLPDTGALLVAVGDGSLRRVEADGKLTEIDRFEGNVSAFALSKDSSRIALGTTSGALRIVDLRTGERRELGRHTGAVLAVAFGPGEKTIATGGLDHTVRIWDLAAGSFRSFDESGWGVRRLVLSKDEKILYILSTGETQLRSLSMETFEHIAPVVSGHRGPISDAELSADGRRILTAGQDGWASLIDIDSGKGRIIQGHPAKAMARFADHDSKVLTFGEDGKLRLWPDDLPETVPELRAFIDRTTPDRIERN